MAELFKKNMDVSIHAPARGATLIAGSPRCVSAVSIHAPARGATNTPADTALLQQVSIHAPARGATAVLAITLVAMAFQSTPLHEGRRIISTPSFHIISFNPRPCTRGDKKFKPPSTCLFVSIHAPARGATDDIRKMLRFPRFQSTPLHEGRLKKYNPVVLYGGFNPRPCTRGDSLVPFPLLGQYRFNPRPCTRGDYRPTIVGVQA